MGKRKRQRDSHEDDRDEGNGDSADDPLGSLIQQHQVNLVGVLLVAGIVGLVGIGFLIYALTRDPISPTFLLVGTAALLFALVFVGMNVFNIGRRLELRKRGVRFVESGIVTEFFWDEIASVEVNRTDRTNYGLVTRRRRSGDAVSPSGPLTNTEWDVTIHAHDGRTMRLRPMFMRTLRDPKKLIGQLKLRAGLP